jgi:hypothetical protein
MLSRNTPGIHIEYEQFVIEVYETWAVPRMTGYGPAGLSGDAVIGIALGSPAVMGVLWTATG